MTVHNGEEVVSQRRSDSQRERTDEPPPSRIVVDEGVFRKNLDALLALAWVKSIAIHWEPSIHLTFDQVVGVAASMRDARVRVWKDERGCNYRNDDDW